jgi:hypothetical protein
MGGEIPAQASRHSWVLRLFPLGGGSSGVRLYVTVRVTTCRTLTAFVVALLGASRYRSFQSDGENGDRRLLVLQGFAL